MFSLDCSVEVLVSISIVWIRLLTWEWFLWVVDGVVMLSPCQTLGYEQLRPQSIHSTQDISPFLDRYLAYHSSAYSQLGPNVTFSLLVHMIALTFYMLFLCNVRKGKRCVQTDIVTH